MVRVHCGLKNHLLLGDVQHALRLAFAYVECGKVRLSGAGGRHDNCTVLALFTKFLEICQRLLLHGVWLNVMPLKRLQNLMTRWGVFLEIFLILFDPLFGQRNGIGHL